MPDSWNRFVATAKDAARRLDLLAADIRPLAARVTANEREASTVPQSEAEASRLMRLMAALEGFPTLVGYLNGRRASGSMLVVTSEADVQDVLYLALKPGFPDLIYEEPTKKGAASFSIGDFSIPCLGLILEAKYIAVKADVKAKQNEICEDIWKYSTQTECRRVIFFVYDPHLLIPDRANYARALSRKADEFIADGRQVEIQTVISP